MEGGVEHTPKVHLYRYTAPEKFFWGAPTANQLALADNETAEPNKSLAAPSAASNAYWLLKLHAVAEHENKTTSPRELEAPEAPTAITEPSSVRETALLFSPPRYSWVAAPDLANCAEGSELQVSPQVNVYTAPIEFWYALEDAARNPLRENMTATPNCRLSPLLPVTCSTPVNEAFWDITATSRQAATTISLPGPIRIIKRV
jgi:hypothetical protein